MCIRDRIHNRSSIATRYLERLAALPGIVLPQGDNGHSWNHFVVRVRSYPNAPPLPSACGASYRRPESHCRDWLKQALQDAGVSTIIYYPIPIHRQPAYAHLGYGEGTFPVTERLCSEVLSLPIFPELTAKQQDQVVKALVKLLSQDPSVSKVNQDRMVA